MIRVILIDDAPDIREILKIALTSDGSFEVVAEAGDGAEGVRLVEEHRPDAVILDLAMPVLDGTRAMPLIRRVSPRTKILILSAFHGAGQDDSSGADAVLDKSAALTQIRSTLHALCEPAPAAG